VENFSKNLQKPLANCGKPSYNEINRIIEEEVWNYTSLIF